MVEAGSHWSTKFTPATGAIGFSFDRLGRRGKFLIAQVEPVDSGAGDKAMELIVHLGMTGRLSLVADDNLNLEHQHLRAWWRLDNGQTLTFHDARRFGRIHFVAPGRYETMPTLHNLGPDPFDPDLDPKRFHALLSKSRRHLKTKLLSQRPIAGVGNIYADEALWLSGINPKVRRLGLDRSGDLLSALREVLSIGISNRGTTLRDYRTSEGDIGANQHTLSAYGRGGQPCFRCNRPLESEVIDARTTTWCVRCQAR